MATSDAPFLCFLCVYVSLSLSLSHTHSHSIRNSVFSRSLRTDTQHGSPSVCLATTSDAICVRRRTRTLSHSTSLLSHLHAHHRTPSLSLSLVHTRNGTEWLTFLSLALSTLRSTENSQVLCLSIEQAKYSPLTLALSLSLSYYLAVSVSLAATLYLSLSVSFYTKLIFRIFVSLFVLLLMF